MAALYRSARRSLTRPYTVHSLCAASQAYNSTRPADVHLTDVKQWRQALQYGPLSNAKRGGKAKGSKRSVSPVKEGVAGPSSAGEGPKRVRGTLYSKAPDGDVPWPPMRLTGRHPIGWHEKGVKNTYCDYPGCNALEKTCTRDSAGGAAAATTPRPPMMPPPAARGKGGSKGAQKTPSTGGSARAPSPTPSDTSSTCSTASQRGTVAKMYCKACRDASNSRPMNFHAECYNAWHELECDVCDDDDDA